jgi:hypothetical protein
VLLEGRVLVDCQALGEDTVEALRRGGLRSLDDDQESPSGMRLAGVEDSPVIF